MGNEKTVKSPTLSDIIISKEMSALRETDYTRYKIIVGSLIYVATRSRSDLSAVASALGSHVEYSTTT